ncbi:MAG: hypothetical protein U0T84_00095 [Chitinophagales bacterium]
MAGIDQKLVEHWTYEEFLAFALVYVAELDGQLSSEEIAFVRQRTGLANVRYYDAIVKDLSDSESMEILALFKKRYLADTAAEQRVRTDLEAMFRSGHHHQQFERVALHLIEKLI